MRKTVLTAALLLAGAAWAVVGDRDGGGTGAGPGTGGSPVPGTGAPATATPGAPPTTAELPPDEQCTGEIRDNPRWVCLTGARFEGGELVIEYEAAWADGVPTIDGGYHLHLYGGDGADPPAEVMGTHAAHQGRWQVEDRSSPVRYPADHRFVTEVVADHPKVCARIADPSHALVPAGDGYATGNCVPVERP